MTVYYTLRHGNSTLMIFQDTEKWNRLTLNPLHFALPDVVQVNISIVVLAGLGAFSLAPHLFHIGLIEVGI